jgi:general secretion pathway protein L
MVDTSGGRLGAVLSGALSDATVLAMGRKVIVLVPGTDVHLAQPTLPIKRGAQLEQVMRYALEENLASDIDHLHFATGKRHSDGTTPVAVVDHKHMQQWLGALAEASIAPDAIYAETDVLNTDSPGTTVVVDNSLVYVKRSNAPGTTLDVRPLTEALLLAFGTNDEITTDAILYLDQDQFETYAAAIDSLRNRIPSLQTKLLPEGPLPLFALTAVKGGAINLLSAQYARKKSWNKSLAPWRIAATLLGVALLLHLGASGVQMWQLTKAEKQLDQQIRDVVAQTLPGTQVNDTRKARQQFEAQLNAMRDSGGGSGLLPSLNVLSATLEQVPDTRIDALAYRTKVIDLRVTAPNVDALARMQQLVNEQGMHAEIQSATPRDNKIEGRLQLKSPGA